MGWIHETETHLHEASLVPVFDDGAQSRASTTVDGVRYQIVEFGQHQADDRMRPSAQIVGWVLCCDCRRWDSSDLYSSEVSTWTDPIRWTRVPSASLENITQHRVYATDTDAGDVDERPDVEEAARAVWQREHLDPLGVDDEIRAAVAARRAADERLAAAAGMTAQSANERWRNRA